jgi:hypothetical protein
MIIRIAASMHAPGVDFSPHCLPPLWPAFAHRVETTPVAYESDLTGGGHTRLVQPPEGLGQPLTRVA